MKIFNYVVGVHTRNWCHGGSRNFTKL